MRNSTRAAAVAVLGAALLGSAGGMGGLGGHQAVAVPATPVVINLVTVNDFHGRIERSGAAAGIAALATAVDEIRAANPNTVFAAAGDLIGASTFTSFVQQDNPAIDALNAAGLDVSAVGNHEFDNGYDDLVNRVVPRAHWVYTGANVRMADGSAALPEYHTETFDGVTIGFIGAVTDELPALVRPSGIAGLTVQAPVDAANRVASQLRDGDPANGEADVVVLLVHDGAATSALASATDQRTAFGRLVTGASGEIDAIVSGHTHLAYNHVINGRPVISSGQYGERFGNMVITVDPGTRRVLSMANTTAELMKGNADGSYSPVFADSPAVAPIVAAATAAADELGSARLGAVAADINRARQPGLDSDGLPVQVENRGAESTMGNFLADAQLWAARSRGPVDVALMHAGGIRADLPYGTDGGVSYRDAASVQPFANPLVVFTLTGAELKAALEQQWQPERVARPVVKLGVNKELSYSYDPDAAPGAHITRLLLSGEPVDPVAAYRVVANAFLAGGGDNFSVLASGTDRTDTGLVDLQALADWFTANGTAVPDLAQRSVGVVLSEPDADGYGAGDALTITLSSLDFSAGETAAGTVYASLAGHPLGSAPVDSTPVQSTDEGGRASILATLPAGITGEQLIEVWVPGTGTSVSVPITLGEVPDGAIPAVPDGTLPGALPATGAGGAGTLAAASAAALLLGGAALLLLPRARRRPCG